MKQPVLTDLFVVEVEQPTPIARECQREGREQAKRTQSALHQRMRELYRQHGFTDDRMAEQLSAYFHRRIQRSTVNARRNEMPDVVEVGKRKNHETGVNNTVWGLTEKGRQRE